MNTITTNTTISEAPTEVFETKSDIIQTVFNATKEHLDAMKDGERITMRDLITKVISDTKKPISMVSGLVPVYVHNYYQGITIRNGQNGGITKGAPKPKIDLRMRCDKCTQVIPKHLLDKLNTETNATRSDNEEALSDEME